jgi:hypothetical protein
MRNVVLFLCSLLIPLNVWANACTTTATGSNWNDASHWASCGATFPVSGDTATVGHATTVNVASAIGTSPAAGSIVLTVNTGITLTVSAPFTLKGDAILNGTGKIAMSAGSTFTFDASAAASPASQHYQVAIGSGHNSSPSFNCSGTSGSHVTITSNTGGGNGRFTDGSGPWLQAGLFNCSYADFSNIGDASNPAILGSVGAAGTFNIDHSTFTSCGRIDSTYNIGADSTYKLLFDTFTTGIDSGGIDLRTNGSTTLVSGQRQLYNNVFNGSLHFYSATSFDIQNNYFGNSFDSTGGVWVNPAQGNFIRILPALAPVNVRGNMTNNYWYVDDATNDNIHFSQVLGDDLNVTIDGEIYDGNAAAVTNMEPNANLLGTPAGVAALVTIQNCYALPSLNNKMTASIVDALGNANTSMAVNHNTIFAHYQGGIEIGETYAGFAGYLTSAKNNIFWGPAAGTGYKINRLGGVSGVNDLVSAANANYNGGYNLAVGNNLKGYNNLAFSAGSPGANDVSGNPGFVDSARNLRKWDTSVGGPGTDADAYARLKADTTQIAALITYVKAGFKFTNAAYHNVGSDGLDLGSLNSGFQAPAATSGGKLLLLEVG